VLDGYNAAHDLRISAHVYAELIAGPGSGPSIIDPMLAQTGVMVDWMPSRAIWIEAGQAYGAYAQRRRAQRPPLDARRILADFVIGAHALHQADALLTFNESDFRTNFPTLQIIVPVI